MRWEYQEHEKSEIGKGEGKALKEKKQKTVNVEKETVEKMGKKHYIIQEYTGEVFAMETQ